MDIKTNKILKDYFKKFSTRKYKKGDIILKPGQNFDAILFPKSGLAIIYTISQKKEMNILPTFEPIFLGSMMNLFLNRKNEFYYKALTNGEYYVAPSKDVLEYIKNDKGLYSKIVNIAVNKLMDMCCFNNKLIFGNATYKVVSMIISACEKYGVKSNAGIEIKFNLPHKMLSNMTGLTRETVTLQLLTLEKKKLITKNGRHLIIKDLEALKKIIR
jgi:CRP/FNR family transcriptional regulator, cyclic AMP receptor protein